MTTQQPVTPRELARRENDGLHIALLWHPRDDALTVTVADTREGTVFQIDVARERAMHAFQHPFAYAA
jgi:hypothetical protein